MMPDRDDSGKGNLPQPLTPPECDLRDYPWMPLDAARLLDSSLFARSTGDEFKAAVALWCKAWGQVPAGSLPDDPRDLAHLSGAGARWNKVKAMALHGWVRCSDGRLYHHVVADKAREAWERKLAQRSRTEAARAARAARRSDTHDDARSSEATTDPVTDRATQSVAISVTDTVTASVTETVTGSTRPDQTLPEQKEEKISSLRSERGEAAPAAQPEEVCQEPAPPLDARTALFREGKARLMRISGKTDRAAGGLIQRWLRETGDDCAMISGLLAMAEADRRYDPIAWVEAAIQKRTGKRDQPPERRSNRAWSIDAMLGRSQPHDPDEARFVPAEELRH